MLMLLDLGQKMCCVLVQIQVLQEQRSDACPAEHHQNNMGCLLWGTPACHFLDPREAPCHCMEVWSGLSHGVWPGRAGE